MPRSASIFLKGGIDCAALGSNACFEAALAIGILSHGVLIADISTNALSSHSFIGLPKTFSTCRSGVGLRRLRRLCWDCSAYKWNENSKGE